MFSCTGCKDIDKSCTNPARGCYTKKTDMLSDEQTLSDALRNSRTLRIASLLLDAAAIQRRIGDDEAAVETTDKARLLVNSIE